MKKVLVLIALVFLVACTAQKPLIPKDTEVKTGIEETIIPPNPEEKESIEVYDQIKKITVTMTKTVDAGKPCKVAAECRGWCEPVEGQKQGKCSWFQKPIGCKKRLERFEIFDVCANLTSKS